MRYKKNKYGLDMKNIKKLSMGNGALGSYSIGKYMETRNPIGENYQKEHVMDNIEPSYMENFLSLGRSVKKILED